MKLEQRRSDIRQATHAAYKVEGSIGSVHENEGDGRVV